MRSHEIARDHMQLLRHGSLSQCKERLYHRPSPSSSSSSSSSVAPSLSLVPILTPPIVDDCRYVLLPESRRIVVRGAQRGTRVPDLVVAPDDDDDDHDGDHDDASSGDGRRGRGGPILSVALAWLPRVVANGRRRRDVTDDSDDDDDEEEGGGGEWIILAGCAGGIVREWPAFDLSNSSSGREDEKNDASARLLLRAGHYAWAV